MDEQDMHRPSDTVEQGSTIELLERQLSEALQRADFFERQASAFQRQLQSFHSDLSGSKQELGDFGSDSPSIQKGVNPRNVDIAEPGDGGEHRDRGFAERDELAHASGRREMERAVQGLAISENTSTNAIGTNLPLPASDDPLSAANAEIERLQLDLADLQLCLADAEQEGEARVRDTEGALVDLRIINARLREDNESSRLLLFEKNLNSESRDGGFTKLAGPEILASAKGSSTADGHTISNADMEGGTNAQLMQEVKTLQESNKAMSLYISHLIEKLLQHHALETVLDKTPYAEMEGKDTEVTKPSLIQRTTPYARRSRSSNRSGETSHVPSAGPKPVSSPHSVHSTPVAPSTTSPRLDYHAADSEAFHKLRPLRLVEEAREAGELRFHSVEAERRKRSSWFGWGAAGQETQRSNAQIQK